MRKCLRCGAEMREGFLLRENNGGRPIGVYRQGKMFGEVDWLKTDACPECGEVSLYLPNVELLKSWEDKEEKQ